LQLLEGQERKRLIDLHMQLSQVIFAELKNRNTSDLSFLEESIIGNCSSDAKKQVMAILSPPVSSTAPPDKTFQFMDKLRLVKFLALACRIVVMPLLRRASLCSFAPGNHLYGRGSASAVCTRCLGVGASFGWRRRARRRSGEN
jgi:hypothetical protein